MYRLIIQPSQQNGQMIELTPQQSHYLRDVVRLQKGDRFLTLNGQGKTWITELTDSFGQILQEISENKELSHPVTLIIGLPKGNGFDEIVRCGTELGVNTFIPAISERTLLKPSSQKVERWRKIAIEASEQCERQRVPEIYEPISLKLALKQVNLIESSGYLCVTRQNAKNLLFYLQNFPPNPIILATGPEGGWTDQEREFAQDIGFIPVSLGNRILRAITAPITALSLISATLDRFSDSSVIHPS